MWGSFKLFVCRLDFSILQKISQKFLFSAKDKSLLHYSFIIDCYLQYTLVNRTVPGSILCLCPPQGSNRSQGCWVEIVLETSWGCTGMRPWLVGMDFPSFHTQRLGAVKVWGKHREKKGQGVVRMSFHGLNKEYIRSRPKLRPSSREWATLRQSTIGFHLLAPE